MKNVIISLMLIIVLVMSCSKENNTDSIDQKLDLHKSNMRFLNSDWTFEETGDSVTDQIIGLWLSNEVSYDEAFCNECDSLFTWVIESTGRMVKRNNDWGDSETIYGDWEINESKDFIFFSFKEYANGGTLDNYKILTDTIRIEYLSKSNLWTSNFINYPPTTKINVKFNRLN